MAFNIERFKTSGLNNGGARPSLFEVNVANWPGIIPGASDQLKFLAKASSLPPSIISEIEVPYFGRRIKIVGDRAYPNWTMTLMNEEDFNVRISLMQWHKLMNEPRINIMGNPVSSDLSSYKRNIQVLQYKKDGKYAFGCTLIGAFPVNISQIGLDWEAVNQVEQYDVEFAYDYWIEGIENSSLSSQDVAAQAELILQGGTP